MLENTNASKSVMLRGWTTDQAIPKNDLRHLPRKSENARCIQKYLAR
jgi:hypothetical protein